MDQRQLFDSEGVLTPAASELVRQRVEADQAGGIYERCEDCEWDGSDECDECPEGYPPEGACVVAPLGSCFLLVPGRPNFIPRGRTTGTSSELNTRPAGFMRDIDMSQHETAHASLIRDAGGPGAAELRLRTLNVEVPEVFCSRRTLSIAYVLEFSTSRQEKLDVEANAFYA